MTEIFEIELIFYLNESMQSLYFFNTEKRLTKCSLESELVKLIYMTEANIYTSEWNMLYQLSIKNCNIMGLLRCSDTRKRTESSE